MDDNDAIIIVVMTYIYCSVDHPEMSQNDFSFILSKNGVEA